MAANQHENTVTENQKAVIGALLNSADALSRKVISAYSPTLKYKTNMKNLERFNADHMEAAAILLGFNVRADSKKLYKNLKVLRDRVILKIESLFESTCLDCGEKYCNSLSDTPLLVCHLCSQGSHNCERVRDKVKSLPRPGGTVWLCFDCFRKNDLTLMPKHGEKPGQLKEVVEEEEEKEDDEDLEGDRNSPRRGRGPEGAESTICEAYKKRQCQHGLTGKRLINGKPCPYRHPPRCFRWCKHGDNKSSGCIKGSECEYFHPKLCKNSLLRRYCANRDCTFHHLKHTRRPKDQLAHEPRGKRESQPRQTPGLRNVDPRFSTQQRPAPLANKFRWDSQSTLNGGTFAPTVDKKSRPGNARERKMSTKSVNDQTDTFLLQLENMKEGIVLQLSQKMAEFQEALPSLVQEQVLQMQISRPPVPPLPLYQLPTQTVQMNRPPTAPPHPQPLPVPNFLNQFPGCSY